MVVVKYCNGVSGHFMETGRICADYINVYSKSNRIDCKIISEELRLLVRQVRQRSILFSAAGFFNIKYSILLKLLGNVSAYAVVVLQFSGED